MLVVGDDDERQPAAGQVAEDTQDVVRALRVEVPRRLVAQQDARFGHERAGDGRPLPLPARQPGGQEVGAVSQADPLQRRQRPLLPAAPGYADVELRQHHVLQHAAVREQVEGLEDEADLPPPQTRPGEVVEFVDVDAVEQVRALGLAVEQTEDVEQR